MNISSFLVIAFIIFSGIIFIIYNVKVAEIQEGHLDEEVAKKSFSKPAGWKVGKMPPELQGKKKIVLNKTSYHQPRSVVEDLVEKWKENDLSKIK